MKCGLAAFAKTPGLSPVKTRLAAGIGDKLAEQFYCMSIEAVKEVLINLNSYSDNAIVPFWAIAEKNGLENIRWSGLPVIWTGEGDLGKRLFNVSKELFRNFESVIMIGTDSPQIDLQLLNDAWYRLKAAPEECVIGPADDGGFYLFGSSYQINEEIWTDIEYSRDDTLENLLQRLKSEGINYSFLKDMADADTFNDLKIIYESLKNTRENNLPKQTNLYIWLESLFAAKNI